MGRYVGTYSERRTVIMGRICSCCGSPVLSQVSAQADLAQRYYSITGGSYIREVLPAEARQAVAETIRQIEICRRDRVPMASRAHRNDQKGFYKSQETLVQGVNDLCPNCFGAEPWMPERFSAKKLEQLQDENFPVLFDDDENAHRWALEWVTYIARQNGEARKNPEAVAAALEEVTQLKTALAELETQRRGLPHWQKKAELEAQREALLARQYDIGILDIKGRIAFQKDMERVDYALKKTDEKIIEDCKPLNRSRTELRIRLQRALMLAYGCEETPITCHMCLSRSFHPTLPMDNDLVYTVAQPDDGRYAYTGTERWRVGRDPQPDWDQMPRLMETRRDRSKLPAVITSVIFGILFLLGHLDSSVSVFTRGWNQHMLWGFLATLAVATVEFLWVAGTNENRKKYAGKFYLLLIGGLMLITAVTGVVVAAVGTLAWSLSLAAVAVIPVAALLILLKMGGVKLTKLRLFTKKQKDHR